MPLTLPELRTEDALRVSEERFYSILETVAEAYYETDLSGTLYLFNDAFCRMLGYSREEMQGMTNRHFQTAAAAKEVYKYFNSVYRTGQPVTRCDWELLRKDGSTLVVEGSIHLVRGPDGTPTGFRGFQRDVTQQRNMEKALRESETKYRGILESITDAYYEVDLAGTIVLCNGAFCRLLGYTMDEIVGTSYRSFQTAEVAAQVYATFNQVYRTGIAGTSFDWAMIRKDGTSVTGEGSVQLVHDLNGKPVGFRGMLRDVTERRRVEQALRDSEARFRALTQLSTDWYWEQDTKLRYIRMESRHGSSDTVQAQFIGKCPWECELELDDSGGWDAHRALLAARMPFHDVVMHRRLPGARPYYISVSGEPIFAADGSFVGYRGVSREITDQKLAEDRIQHLATHDALTGLPNRSMFNQLLGDAIRQAQRLRSQFAVLFVDLDRFKNVNDTLGHQAGDLLLQEVTARYKLALRASDVVARLGGDEFVVLVRELELREHATVVARKLLSCSIKPVLLAGRECRVTASIGIALYPEAGEDELSLMKNADIAMYRAKEKGKNTFEFYSNDLPPLSLERLTLENLLRRALERGELDLHYQPKRDLKSGAISGAEALLRWNSVELGPISPAQFIPVAEETGLIIPIGKWVLKTACEENMAWQRAGLPPVRVAVNLSVRQFSDEHLLADIAAILEETGMPAGLLELEITEGMVINNPAHTARLLDAIKAMGIRLAIDDFGTGYSSLGQLKNFPIDTLKIDRTFVRDIETNPRDRAITEAIIAMGKTLGLTVVAEGVETPAQESFLRERDCDEMQGFLFARPMPAGDFLQLLHNHTYPARPVQAEHSGT